MKTSKLLDDDAHLVAYLGELPFQKGRPLYPIDEEGGGERNTKLVYSSTSECTPDRHVYMASMGDQYTNKLPKDISMGEDMTNTCD